MSPNSSLVCLQTAKDGRVALMVRVQPRSSVNRVAGLQGEHLKVCLTAPPVDGKANQALIAFLAPLFRLPKTAVTIQSGAQGRTKRLLLAGTTFEEMQNILHHLLAST